MRESTSFGALARRLPIILPALIMVVIYVHYYYPDTLFASPLPATPTPRGWLSPSGGKFKDPACPGIEITFPEGFLDVSVNAHCNRTALRMQLPPGLTDVGLRFFFGVWSGFGEVTKFQRPLHFRIPYEEQRDGKQIIPRGMETKLSLCIWEETTGTWHCLPSNVDETANVVTAMVDSLLPTRYIQGWNGNSLMALLIQTPASSPVPSAMPTRTPTQVPSPTPTATRVPSPTPTATQIPTRKSVPRSPTHVPQLSLRPPPTTTSLVSEVSPSPSSIAPIDVPPATSKAKIDPSRPPPALASPSPSPSQAPEQDGKDAGLLPIGLALGVAVGLAIGLGIAVLRSRKG